MGNEIGKEPFSGKISTPCCNKRSIKTKLNSYFVQEMTKNKILTA